jgi:hypothetical protein
MWPLVPPGTQLATWSLPVALGAYVQLGRSVQLDCCLRPLLLTCWHAVCDCVAACGPHRLPGTQCATWSLPVALSTYLARSVRLGRCL